MKPRVVEELSYGDKETHWSGPTPWTFRGRQKLRISNTVSFRSSDITMSGGDIEKMPALVGKPCFGIITMWLRHGGEQPRWDARYKKARPSRCMQCKVKGACEFVVSERIKAGPEVATKFKAWAKHGRRSTFGKDTKTPQASKAWRALVFAIQRNADFSSTNDAVALKHALRVAKDQRVREARHKIRERRKLRSKGKLDREFKHNLGAEANVRLKSLLAIRLRSDAPRQLKGIDQLTAERTVNVWQASMSLAALNKPMNNSAIARYMIDHKLEWLLSHNVLRQRVGNDLDRVRLLESTSIPGDAAPIWKRFDPDSDLKTDYWRGLDLRPAPLHHSHPAGT